MRCAMTRVLPEPAPARISSAPSVLRTASCCSGLRLERRSKPRSYRRHGSRDDGSKTPKLQLPTAKSDIALGSWMLEVGSLLLFHRHRLRQVPRLIDVAAATHGDVIRQQLQRDGHDD